MAERPSIFADIPAALAQGALFTIGLVLSLAVGMVLVKHTSGIGWLIVATLVSGAGLLVTASLSQQLHDYLLFRKV